MSDPERTLVLASTSPRRRDLLQQAGVAFEVVPPRVDEEPAPGEAPEALALRLAAEKALEVAGRLGATPERWVLGADTIVVLDDEVLGKPADPAHAVELLSRLVGRSHRVVTGVAVVSSARLEARARAVSSLVTMRAAARAEIEAYVATGEPLDKAGAYGFQGGGRRFVVRVEGSESNVIGLPLDESLALLREARGAEGGA